MHIYPISPSFSAQHRKGSGRRRLRQEQRREDFHHGINTSRYVPFFTVEAKEGEQVRFPTKLTSYHFMSHTVLPEPENRSPIIGADVPASNTPRDTASNTRPAPLQPTMRDTLSGEALIPTTRRVGDRELIILQRDETPMPLPQLEAVGNKQPTDIVFANEVPSATVDAILNRPFNPQHLPAAKKKRG